MIDVDTLDDPRVGLFGLVADHRALVDRGLFVAEGRLVVTRLLECSARAGHRFATALHSVLLSQAAWREMAALFDAHPHVPCYVVPQAVMNGIVGFNIHRGCLALARRPGSPALDGRLLATKSRVVVLEGVNNPDNIGGIFRSAAAFGVNLVVLGPACGDPLYRKAVRTSIGAVLEVPFAPAPEWGSALQMFRPAGLTLLALTTSPGAGSLTDVSSTTDRVAVMAGAEGHGLTAHAMAAADLRLRIPMTVLVDSLNVTTAVSIALHHLWQG